MRKPLFCGNSDIDQLYKIFEIMGLPSEQDWPSQAAVPRSSFTSSRNGEYKAQPLENVIRNLDEHGKSLLLRLLDFNLFNRITARDALLHDFFKQDIIDECEPASNSNNQATLPDITNIFQPNILKRKRTSQIQSQQNE